MRLIVDGKPVMSATGVDNTQGYVGLRPEAGTVEFRRIAVAVVPVPRPVPPSSVLAAPSAGLQNPQAVKQSKPAYAPQAMAGHIEGTVLIAGVVQPDGTLQNPRVVQSLDSKLGLNRQALDSLKAWGFRAQVIATIRSPRSAGAATAQAHGAALATTSGTRASADRAPGR